MLHIAVINETVGVSDDDIQKLVPAFSTQWNRDLRPVWGISQAQFAVASSGKPPPPGAWWVAFFDTSDQAGALGYYDLTDEGLPLAKIFAGDLSRDETGLGVGASHEICELAVDPWLNGAYQDAAGAFWARDICDPVEDDKYGYDISGVLVTDFVTPDWFAPGRAGGSFDFMGHVNAPFEILAGGHAQKFDPASGWRQIAGSQAQLSARVTDCTPGSRRERRIRQWRSRFERSEPQTWSR